MTTIIQQIHAQLMTKTMNLFYHIKTTDELLGIGLKLANYNQCKIKRGKKEINNDRFVAHFGDPPEVCAEVYENLQKTLVVKAWVSAKELKLSTFSWHSII